jgi:hypothetical protein
MMIMCLTNKIYLLLCRLSTGAHILNKNMIDVPKGRWKEYFNNIKYNVGACDYETFVGESLVIEIVIV